MMGVREMARFLEQWEMGVKDVHRRLILAPTPRERERWHAVWLLVHGWTASATAEALGRDPHTIGRWASAFGEGGPAALIFEQTVVPPVLGETQQAELKAAVPELPEQAGIELANWYWKVVRQFVAERFGIELSRSSCLNYLHRLGFAFKRPKKRLLKADEAKREAFVAEYAALSEEAQRSGPRYSSPTRPISVRTPSCGASGCSGESRPWWTQQPALWGEGQLLFGGLPGDRRGGVDGTGGQQQLRNLSRLPGTTEGEAPRAAERDLGQCPGASWRGGKGVSEDT